MISTELSANTQAILLLTAPLRMNGREPAPKHLTPGEYGRLARVLRGRGREPGDLLAPDAGPLVEECCSAVEPERVGQLLGRGFLLAQAVERWAAKAIWVSSRADPGYPRRWKTRLGESAPPVLYGCGDVGFLESGGLAVVGSRDADPALVEYTGAVGRLAAKARRSVISGGARGIDQAALRGALDGGGRVVAIVADSLERAAVQRDHRQALMSGQLLLLSAHDPAAGFHVGYAMQRNRLIYALADCALVVNADFEKGGTWAGAVEQLGRLRLVPVYVRTQGATGKGLEGLRGQGALPWPEPATPEALASLLDTSSLETGKGEQRQHELPYGGGASPVHERGPEPEHSNGDMTQPQVRPADELFARVREILARLETPTTEGEIAAELQVTRVQARAWIKRLVQEGVLQKLSRPVRYLGVGR